MADAQRTIDLIFNGVDKTGAAVQSALKNTGQFATGVESATQPIADFTAGALKFEAALLTAGAAATAFAVKLAGDFDSQFREIATLIDQPIDALGDFRQAILDYGANSTAPLEQVTSAIYNAISAGVDFEQAIAAVAQAEKISIAGKADLNSSLLVLVSSLNAYGEGMDQAERYSDALFQTVVDGQTNMSALAAGLSQVTGTASTLEVPFETLLAAIGALTKTGTPTQQAITQINAAMSALIKPSADAASLAQELGIEFSAQAVKAQGLDGVLRNVAEATGGNEQQMARLFGSVEALRAVLPLTGNAADFFAENLVNMANKAGATETAVSKMSGKIDQEAQKVINAFTVMLAQVGTPLLDEFGGITDALVGIFDALRKNVEQGGGLADLVKYVESIMGDLEGSLEQVAKNLPAALEGADFSAFREGVDAVVGALKNLFADIDLSTVEGLRKAIEVTGQAFLGLSNYTAGVIDAFKPLFDTLTGAASGLDGLDMSWARDIGELAGYATQLNIAAGALSGMVEPLSALAALFVGGQAASMAGGIAAAAASLSGKTGLVAMLGTAGLAGAAGLAGYGVGKATDAITEMATGKGLTDRLSDWLTSFTDLDEEAARLTETVEVGRREFEKKPKSNGIEQALEEIIVTAEKIKPEVFGEPLQEIEVSAKRVENAFKSQGTSIAGVIPVYDEVTGKLVGYTDGVSGADQIMNQVFESSKDAAKGLAGVGEEADKARVFTEGAFIELEKLASNERIRFMEAKISLDIAEVEANAERVIAAFDSVNVGIESTGSMLEGLFSGMGDASGLREKFAIERQIEDENRRRDEAFEMQKKLTEEEIRLMRAKADSVERGDAIIKINGDGLAPHLEAFMWEVLEGIQTRVNQEGLDMLFG